MNGKGMKKEFFYKMANRYLLGPLVEWKDRKGDFWENTRLDDDGDPFTEEQLEKHQVGDYRKNLMIWKTIVAMAVENGIEAFDSFHWLEDFDSMPVYPDALGEYRRTRNRDDLEVALLTEYIKFQELDKDFNGNPWDDRPLSEKERAFFEKTVEARHPVTAPPYIKRMERAGLIARKGDTDKFILVQKLNWRAVFDGLALGVNLTEIAKSKTIVNRRGNPYTATGLVSTVRKW